MPPGSENRIARRPVDKPAGALVLGGIGILVFLIWPVAVLLTAILAAELKVIMSAASVLARRLVSAPAAQRLRFTVGVVHLVCLIFGLTAIVLFPVQMLIATFFAAFVALGGLFVTNDRIAASDASRHEPVSNAQTQRGGSRQLLLAEKPTATRSRSGPPSTSMPTAGGATR